MSDNGSRNCGQINETMLYLLSSLTASTFHWSGSRTLSGLIRSQEKELYYTFLLSEN